MSTTIESTIANDYATILARTGSEAEIQSWVSVVDSGALTLAQVESAFIASPEAQQDVVPIIELYQTELNRAPDAAGLAAWVAAEKSGVSLTQIAADIANSAESQALYGDSTAVNTAFLTALYQTALGRAPDTAGLNAWLNSGLTQAQIEYAFATSPEAVARITPAADAFLASVAEGGPYGGSLFAAAPGGTFTLTTGVDNLALTGNNNTVNGTANGANLTTAATFNTGDSIEGAAGSTGNVLNLADIGGSGFGSSGSWDPTNLAGVTVSGIQTVNLDSTEAVSANTASSIEGFSGLTALNVQDSGGSDVTAAGTTAISITDLDAGSASEDVNGGSSVSVTTQDETTGRIRIGSAVAPTGTVTVIDSSNPASSSVSLGSITVSGGTVVDVTENEVGAVNHTIKGGGVTVSGSATTTSVSVTQTAPATSSSTATGVVDGTVVINDVNGTSLTEAGTITSVSLSNYGLGATITDNALANLTLAGTGGGVTITDDLTTPTAATLNLSVNGLTDTTGITDANNEITTLNVVTGGTTASTLGPITDSGLTTLNVSGTQAFNLQTPSSSLTAINVSGGAGLSSGPGVAYALGANTAFTSTSTGTDLVSISGPATKTVTGNGSANEEIVWNSSTAPAAATEYLGKVTGFSVLGLGSLVGSAGIETFDMSKLTGFTGFDVEGSPLPRGPVSLTNVAAGSPLAIDGEFDGNLVYQTSDTAGASDSLAVTLGAATTDGFTVGSLSLEDSQLNGIGNLTVTSNASASAQTNIITTLTDPSLSSLTVAGTASLTITGPVNTNATSLTIDGTSTGTSPITIGDVNDANLTTLNLAGSDTLALGTVTGSASGVTVNGSGDNAAVTINLVGAQGSGTDTINLGNGNNSVIDNTGSTKATVDVTVGTGANNIVLGTATNNVTFGAHSTTTADNVGVSGSVDSTIVPSAVITGLNAAGADTITFAGDPAATGPISTYTATQINQFGIDSPAGTPPTTLAGAVADVLASTGGNLATHSIGEFQFQNNTYFVEQAGATGSAFGTGDTVVQLGGLNTFTTATNATGGVLHLVG